MTRDEKIANALAQARLLKKQGRYPEAFTMYESLIEVLQENKPPSQQTSKPHKQPEHERPEHDDRYG